MVGRRIYILRPAEPRQSECDDRILRIDERHKLDGFVPGGIPRPAFDHPLRFRAVNFDERPRFLHAALARLLVLLAGNLAKFLANPGIELSEWSMLGIRRNIDEPAR